MINSGFYEIKNTRDRTKPRLSVGVKDRIKSNYWRLSLSKSKKSSVIEKN